MQRESTSGLIAPRLPVSWAAPQSPTAGFASLTAAQQTETHLWPGLWMGMREWPECRMLCSVPSSSSWSALSMNTCATPRYIRDTGDGASTGAEMRRVCTRHVHVRSHILSELGNLLNQGETHGRISGTQHEHLRLPEHV